MGIQELIHIDAREESEEGHHVCHIQGLCLAHTTSEEAANLAMAINDDRAQITTVREDTGFVVIGKNSPLLWGLVGIVAKVHANICKDAGSTANGDASGVTILYDKEAVLYTPPIIQADSAQTF